MENTRWGNVLIGSVVMALFTFALHPLGMMVVFIPLGLGLLCCFVFYRMLVASSNPGETSISERWADGQPLGRIMLNEKRVAAVTAEIALHEQESNDRKQTIHAEAAAEARHNDTTDYKGPPPRVPFP